MILPSLEKEETCANYSPSSPPQSCSWPVQPLCRAEAAPVRGLGDLSPITKGYSPVETVGCWCGLPLLTEYPIQSRSGAIGSRAGRSTTTCEHEPGLVALILGEIWWSQAGSNRRPRECHSRALPTELWPLQKPEITASGPRALELGRSNRRSSEMCHGNRNPPFWLLISGFRSLA